MPSLNDAHLSLDEVKLILKSCGVDDTKIDSYLPKGDATEIVTVHRNDFSAHKIGFVKRTDEGYLQGDAAVAKVGVMKYALPGGKTRLEYLPPETLFSTKAMDSLKLKPITNSHPTTLLDSKSVKQRKVGFTGENVKRDGDFLTVSMVVTDSDAIDSVDAGKQELSPGYVCHLLMQPGTFQDQKYDAIQVGRVYNHVALCDTARGGPDLRLNFDGIDSSLIPAILVPTPPIRKGKVMPYKVDGIEYEAAQEVVNHIGKLDTQIQTITGKADQQTVTIDALTKEKTDLLAKVDTLEKRDIRADVARRLHIETVATKVLDKKDITDALKLDDKDLRKKVVLAKCPDAKLDDKSEEYITSRFDMIAETSATPAASTIPDQRRATAPRYDSGTTEDKVGKSHTDMVDKLKKAWMPEEKK